MRTGRRTTKLFVHWVAVLAVVVLKFHGIDSLVEKDVADETRDAMPLACAKAEYSPIVVHKISPRGVLFIAVEGDAVTPEQQSFHIYDKAQEPKKLVLYKKTTHCGIDNDYL